MYFRGLVTQYSVQNILPLKPFLSQLNRVHIYDMSFKILLDIIRLHLPNIMGGLVSSVTLNAFCVPFSYPSRLSHSLLISPCYMKSWELRRRPRNFDFCFTLRLLYSRKPFGLDIVTKRQCLPVSGIDPVLPLSCAAIGFIWEGKLRRAIV